MKVESESMIWFYRYGLIVAIAVFVVLIVGGLVLHPDVRASESSLIFGKTIGCVNDLKTYSALENRLFSCIGLNEKDSQKYYLSLLITQDNQQKPPIIFGVKSAVGCSQTPKEKEIFCLGQVSGIILDGRPALLNVYIEIK